MCTFVRAPKTPGAKGFLVFLIITQTARKKVGSLKIHFYFDSPAAAPLDNDNDDDDDDDNDVFLYS